MADARPARSPLRLFAELPQADRDRRRAVCSVRGLERHSLLRNDSSLHCRVCGLLRTFRPERTARSHQCPDRPTTRLLFLVAVCGFVFAPAVARNSRLTDRTCCRTDCPCWSAVFL